MIDTTDGFNGSVYVDDCSCIASRVVNHQP